MFRKAALFERRKLSQQRGNDSFTTVNMNLRTILARKRVRPGKNKHQTAIKNKTVTSPNRFQNSLTRGR